MSLLIHQANDSGLRKIYVTRINLTLFEASKACIRIDKILRKRLKRNKTKIVFLIIAFLIATPIYISQYTRIYNNPNESEKLTVEGMFLD